MGCVYVACMGLNSKILCVLVFVGFYVRVCVCVCVCVCVYVCVLA